MRRAVVLLWSVWGTAGQMDRAWEYVRRCLFVLEAGYCDSFRPQEGGRCRLDARRPENRAYLTALFRHMQMAGARGLYATAHEVARLLLSLDPLYVRPTSHHVRLRTHACTHSLWSNGGDAPSFASYGCGGQLQQGRSDGCAAGRGLLRRACEGRTQATGAG